MSMDSLSGNVQDTRRLVQRLEARIIDLQRQAKSIPARLPTGLFSKAPFTRVHNAETLGNFTFTVPAKVRWIRLMAIGTGGGTLTNGIAAWSGAGGGAGSCLCYLDVVPGDTISMVPGSGILKKNAIIIIMLTQGGNGQQGFVSGGVAVPGGGGAGAIQRFFAFGTILTPDPFYNGIIFNGSAGASGNADPAPTTLHNGGLPVLSLDDTGPSTRNGQGAGSQISTGGTPSGASDNFRVDY